MLKKLILCSTLAMITSCAAMSNKGDPNDTRSLYERLGGLPAIQAVVEDFKNNVFKDERINSYFYGADEKHFVKMLVEQICQATGGPCKYTGRSMIDVHTGMNIREDQFNALVEDLVKSLNKYNVSEREKNELLKLLGSMKGVVINI